MDFKIILKYLIQSLVLLMWFTQMPAKLIIFDIDGTLTNTNHVDSILFETAILEVLPISSINTNWHDYKYSTDTGIVTQIFQSKLNRDPLAKEIELIKDKFICYLSSAFLEDKTQCTLIKGAGNIFDKVLNLGWDVAIATGGWEKSAILKLQTAEIYRESIPISHSDDDLEREKIISIAIKRAQEY